MEYVAGLLFNVEMSVVALVRKNRPAWQAGLYNAIGGKIEEGESPHAAMVREFKEETGLLIPMWMPLAVLSGWNKDWAVNFYYQVSDEVWNVQTMEDEPITIHRVENVLWKPYLVRNLKVLIPLALDTTGIQKPLILTDVS